MRPLFIVEYKMKHLQQMSPIHYCATISRTNYRIFMQKRPQIYHQPFLNRKAVFLETCKFRHTDSSFNATKEDEAAQSSSSSEMDAEKMTSGKFRAEFDQQFVAFMKPMDLSPDNLAKFKPAVDQFVDEFNGKHAESGFRIEQANPDMNFNLKLYKLAFHSIMVVLFGVMIMYSPRSDMSNEHKAIFAQPGIVLEQFIQDFLAEGAKHNDRVKMVLHYPLENKAVAIFGADVDREGRKLPPKGIPILLAESFAYDPYKFKAYLEQTSSHLGEPVMVIVRKDLKIKKRILYIVGCCTLLLLVSLTLRNGWQKFFLNRKTMFRVVPIEEAKN